ncbi:MAG: ABC transporter ATP-binding protein [Pirellulales bacterium]
MLEIQNLKKAFTEPNGQALPILDIPSFRIEAGEQVVLLGKSGGGKTTLLHIIAGITKADTGVVKIDGINMVDLSESGRDRVRAAKVGYVFQTFNLLAPFSALENVRLGMTFARGKHDLSRATELLQKVGLADRMHYKPGALSVGQQQRVAVARALANRPQLLLADEPTANVDTTNQQKIIDLIRNVCREEKVALLLVTHSQEVANQFDRVEQLEKLNRVLHAAPAVA